MFYWRGEYKPGYVCVTCNSLWAIAGHEIEPLRGTGIQMTDNTNLIPGLERAREIIQPYLPKCVITGRHPIIEAWEDLNQEIEREKAKIPKLNDKPESFAHTLMHCRKCGEFIGHGHEDICRNKLHCEYIPDYEGKYNFRKCKSCGNEWPINTVPPVCKESEPGKIYTGTDETIYGTLANKGPMDA